MFIVDLHYIVPLEQLDVHMTAHVKFLRKYYKENIFIASGRKVPRTGGIILAVAKSREDLDTILSEDPFFKLKLAEFKIVEFQTSQYHSDMKGLLNAKSEK
ncbi:MAG TPA: YciI family protein [Chryseolinea sp.]|nr:YciI family protein [Chryseolinea sp.]